MALGVTLLGAVSGSASAQVADDEDRWEIEPTQSPRSQGSLVAEVLGGLGGMALSVGIFEAIYQPLLMRCPSIEESSGEQASDCKSISSATAGLVTLAAAPFLVVGGVSLAGGATGGNGGYGWSLIGGLLALAPGIMFLSVADAPVAIGAGIALLPIGFLVGAVIGYRITSTAPTVNATIAPTSDRRGAMLVISGTI